MHEDYALGKTLSYILDTLNLKSFQLTRHAKGCCHKHPLYICKDKKLDMLIRHYFLIKIADYFCVYFFLQDFNFIFDIHPPCDWFGKEKHHWIQVRQLNKISGKNSFLLHRPSKLCYESLGMVLNLILLFNFK